MESEWRSDSFSRDGTDEDRGNGNIIIGPKDMKLAHALIDSSVNDGTGSHSKFLRQIMVSVDIEAPLYLWKELDQYKIGTVTDSESTMHRLAKTPITPDCFEMTDFSDGLEIPIYDLVGNQIGTKTLDSEFARDEIAGFLEQLRAAYNTTGDKRYWKELIRWLPEGWLQKRKWTANYQVVRNIYNDRVFHVHKLNDWAIFGKWISALPYSKDLIQYGFKEKNG